MALQTDYSYDAVGNRTERIVTEDGLAVTDTLTYDAFSNRLETVATPVTLASGLTHEAFGGLDGMAWGNGITLALGHDLDGRMVSMDAFKGATAILDLDYTYDLGGRITNIADIADIGGGNRGRDFAYDALHRLTQGKELAAGGSPVTLQTDYTWDAVGNRLTRNAGGALDTLAYDAFSNRLATVTTGATVRTLGYSPSGNTASDNDGLGTVLTHTYDSTDRLAQIAQGVTTVATYLHNAQGQRVAKTVGAAVTHYVYDLGGNLIAEADGSTGAATAEYVWLGGMPLAYIASAGVYYVHPDHLNTPQRVTDAAAAVVWDADYRPFGEATVTGALTFNLRFPGQYFDAETALHYNGMRDYDAGTGRYVQSDPIGLSGGWNSYAYVGGNPITRLDPRGLSMEDVETALADARKWVYPSLKYPSKIECFGTYYGGGGDKPTRGWYRYWEDIICLDQGFLRPDLCCADKIRLVFTIIHETLHRRDFLENYEAAYNDLVANGGAHTKGANDPVNSETRKITTEKAWQVRQKYCKGDDCGT